MKKNTDLIYEIGRLKNSYTILSAWLELRQNNITLEKYFADRDYKTIAVYGMGVIGRLFCDELADANVQITYAIDSTVKETYRGIEVIALENELAPVDVIVMTIPYGYEEIENELLNRTKCPIIPLEKIVTYVKRTM